MAERFFRSVQTGRRSGYGPVLVGLGTLALDLGITSWYLSRASQPMLINHGIAFGIGAGHPELVVLSVGAGLATILALYWRWPAARYPLAVIGGGAVANIVSRVAYGGVVDYWRWPPYPYTFNAADIAIRGGLVYLVLAAWLTRPSAQRR